MNMFDPRIAEENERKINAHERLKKTPSGYVWRTQVKQPNLGDIGSYLENMYKSTKASFLAGHVVETYYPTEFGRAERDAPGYNNFCHPTLYIYLQFPQKVTGEQMTALYPGLKFEPTHGNEVNWKACVRSQEMTVDGPWTFGVDPSLKFQMFEQAQKTKLIYSLGPEQALDMGLISLLEYPKYVDAIQMVQVKQRVLENDMKNLKLE